MGNIPLYISIIVLIELFVLDITQSVGVNTDFIPGYTTFPRDRLLPASLFSKKVNRAKHNMDRSKTRT